MPCLADVLGNGGTRVGSGLGSPVSAHLRLLGSVPVSPLGWCCCRWEGSRTVVEGAGGSVINSELGWRVSAGQSWAGLVAQCQADREVAPPGL